MIPESFQLRSGNSATLVDSALAHELNSTVLKLREKAIENIRQDQEKQREHYNKKRVTAPVYKPGDMVLLEREPVATGESRKLRPKYRGPYVVVEKLPHDRYRVQDLPETQRSQRFYDGIAAVDKMKRFVSCDEGSDDNQSPDSECEGSFWGHIPTRLQPGAVVQ
ncbi:hypothetical protein ISCGN_020902 [Ixodes scapularis]